MKRGLNLILILLLVLLGQSLAQSRGQTMVAGHIVLCSGATVTVVQIGPDGTPIKAPQFCPDMSLGLIAALATPGADLLPMQRQRGFEPWAEIGTFGTQSRVQPQARGPPGRIV